MSEQPQFTAGSDLAELQSAMAKINAAGQDDFPSAPEIRPDIIDLPGGLRVPGTDTLITTAQVRELNGGDEEKIYRAILSRKPAHIFATILECGVSRLGNLSEEQSQRLLPNLLIGDRDALLLAIRSLTYDPDVRLVNWTCPECGEKTNIDLDLAEDVEVRKLDKPGDATFLVDLRNGAKARVHLPSGADQLAAGDDPERTPVERSTIILQRCVEEVEDSKGVKHVLAGFPSYAKQMGIKDRHAILEEISKRQPGPQYTDIKFTHQDCGKEVTLGLDLLDLFLG